MVEIVDIATVEIIDIATPETLEENIPQREQYWARKGGQLVEVEQREFFKVLDKLGFTVHLRHHRYNELIEISKYGKREGCGGGVCLI